MRQATLRKNAGVHDDNVVAGDALAVINFINAFGAGKPGPSGEGEPTYPVSSIIAANIGEGEAAPAFDEPVIEETEPATANGTTADLVIASTVRTGLTFLPNNYVRSAHLASGANSSFAPRSFQPESKRTANILRHNDQVQALDSFFTEIGSGRKSVLRRMATDRLALVISKVLTKP